MPWTHRPFGKKQQRLHVPSKWPAEPIDGNAAWPSEPLELVREWPAELAPPTCSRPEASPSEEDEPSSVDSSPRMASACLRPPSLAACAFCASGVFSTMTALSSSRTAGSITPYIAASGAMLGSKCGNLSGL